MSLIYYVNYSPCRLNYTHINSNIGKANRTGDVALGMADWEITATTIYCDAVDDEVTLMVYGDGTVRCTGHQKYARPDKETAREMKKKSQQSGKQLGCSGLDCPRVVQYRDSLLGEK